MPSDNASLHYTTCGLSGKKTLHPAYCNAPCRDMHDPQKTVYPAGTPFRHASQLVLLPHNHPWFLQADRLRYEHEHDKPILQEWLSDIGQCGEGQDDEWRWLTLQVNDPLHWQSRARIVVLRNTVLQIWCLRLGHDLHQAKRNLFL